ncbi:MAG: AlpA family phage regulatory protein [Burkholderiaceae bacterium]|nr:AlpA family phage regulatory protein [Burkholderiaceae bacterium]
MNTEHFMTVQLLTFPEACQLLRFSRTTLWRRIQTDPSFPRPVQVGARSPRLSLQEIEKYLTRSREGGTQQG